MTNINQHRYYPRWGLTTAIFKTQTDISSPSSALVSNLTSSPLYHKSFQAFRSDLGLLSLDFTEWCFFTSYSALHEWATQCLTRDRCRPWNEGIDFKIHHFSVYLEILIKTKHLFSTKNALKRNCPEAYFLTLLLHLHRFVY